MSGADLARYYVGGSFVLACLVFVVGIISDAWIFLSSKDESKNKYSFRVLGEDGIFFNTILLAIALLPIANIIVILSICLCLAAGRTLRRKK